jgi:hypothetical protein
MRWFLAIIFIPFIYFELIALFDLKSHIMYSREYLMIAIFFLGTICFIFSFLWSIKLLYESRPIKYYFISLVVFCSCVLTWLPSLRIPHYGADFYFVCFWALFATVITLILFITRSLITKNLKGQPGHSGFEKSGKLNNQNI